MEYGICDQAIVPVRLQPGDQQEMVNQLLFGDLVVVKGSVKDWILIETFDDQYEGWIDCKQIVKIDKKSFNELIVTNRHYSLELATRLVAEDDTTQVLFCLGSQLPYFQNNRFRLNDRNFVFEGKTKLTSEVSKNPEIINIAKKYLETPYLWGGRSPFGIDCSGFIQIVYKICGIFLPRDSSQQVDHGETVNFIHEALSGDLAFFGNEEGDIVHVGILLDNQNIIHASGKVRIDNIDHQGIFNKTLNKYTHQLRIIKRLNQ